MESNLGQARMVLAEMKARYEQGVALQNDITRYELLVSSLEFQLIKIANTLEILNNNLVVTAGMPEGTVIVPDSAILARSLPSSGETWWQEEASQNAPALKLARNGLDISRKAEDLVRSERLPKVGLQATFACNSTIQLWLTPVRDMAIFFCYVYIVVDSVIQLSGIVTIYTAFLSQWEYMHWIMTGLLVLMILLVLVCVRPVRAPMFIPLLGIDWIGALLWAVFMLCFTFVCTYGNFYDWWDSSEICIATLLGLVCMVINLWRASFLHHPYICFMAMKNRNVIIATLVYMVFFTLLATEHVFEHSYAANILGFDETNLIDLNWYVFAGIIVGCGFTYLTFALRKWRYKTMTAIAFALAIVYLAYFYFFIDYGVEKEMLFIPLFFRGAASVIVSIVYLTSIVQSGLPFQIFPQALTINGFTGAVMGAVFGPAVIGEFFRHTMARNAELLSATAVDFNPAVSHIPVGQLFGTIQLQAMVVSMKEIYGWLLIAALVALVLILVSYSSLRPWAIFPKWRTVRRALRRLVRQESRDLAEEQA